MNSKLKIIITVLVYFAISISSSGLCIANDKTKRAEQLMDLAGSTWAITFLVEEIALEQVKEKIIYPDDGLTETERSIYFKQFELEGMLQSVRQVIVDSLTEKELDELIDYFSQPLIVKMLENEKAEQLGNPQIDTKKYLKSIMNNLPSKSRIELIHELVDVSLMVEQQVYFNAVMIYEKNKASLSYQDEYDEEQAQRLEYYIENFKQNMADSIRPEMRLVFMRNYDSFSDGEISSLISLMKEKKRLKYQALFVDTLAEVLAERIRKGITALLVHREKKAS